MPHGTGQRKERKRPRLGLQKSFTRLRFCFAWSSHVGGIQNQLPCVVVMLSDSKSSTQSNRLNNYKLQIMTVQVTHASHLSHVTFQI